MTRLEKIKNLIEEKFELVSCGLFFCRTTLGEPDIMENVYNEDGVIVDFCYTWSYVEVIGLTKEEQKELTEFYNDLHHKMYDIPFDFD